MRSVVSVLPEWPPDARRSEEPEGSGVVVLDGKTIVTALHVVDRARSVRIRTRDGKILKARLSGRDRATDIATLTIDTALPPITPGDGEPHLGDRVCAIGNAFGLGLSVTCGVVSGLNRAGVGFNRVEDFVQTDAAVNPGASGGALVTDKGEFVGLLSAIFTKTSDANIGVNFAVSARMANDIARNLREHGRVGRPISGMRMEAAPGEGETGVLGARVVSMRPGSRAERAGLLAGDVIVRAGGRRVRKPADFVSAMSLLLRADELEVEVIRDGANKRFRLMK
ncbi:MAG: trypsin-like peptidase domain-containing protein [Hyphomicrobiaceae bacterium]|nr:trypsin-like peptidase domain-containing protein [Hyphomicrobiaceae bacterium]